MSSRRFQSVCTTLLVLAFVGAEPLRATESPVLILHVDATSPSPSDGLSWAAAMHRLEDAIGLAVLPGTEIRVACGTYHPDGGSGDRGLSFLLNTGIVIRGGYAGFGAPDPDHRDLLAHPTILSGDIGIPGDSTDNSFHVVRAVGSGLDALLSGVTLRAGRADGAFPDDRGGGLITTAGAHRFEDCRFLFNFGVSGGAVDLGNGAAPTFVNCTFSSNLTSASGGAVTSTGADPTFITCVFMDNSAEISGGAVAVSGGESYLVDCLFVNNSSMIFGGGYYNGFGASTLIDCVFTNNFMLNSASISFDGGGGLYNHSGIVMVYGSTFASNVTSDNGAGLLNRNGMLLLERCILRSNWAAERGGGIYSSGGTLELSNCSLLANTGAAFGGGLHLTNTNTMVTNVTFFGNKSNGLAGGIQTSGGSLAVDNSIFWGNFDSTGTSESTQLRWLGGKLAVNYTCMMGWTGTFGGEGNLSTAPMFVSAFGPDGIAGTEDDDVRLLPSSPCIDGGDPTVSLSSKSYDLDGQPRVMGCRVDMGAYEFVTGPVNSGDMDANGVIDGRDINGFIQALLGVGPPAYQCVADLNADEVVDPFDLAIFVSLLLGS